MVSDQAQTLSVLFFLTPSSPFFFYFPHVSLTYPFFFIFSPFSIFSFFSPFSFKFEFPRLIFLLKWRNKTWASAGEKNVLGKRKEGRSGGGRGGGGGFVKRSPCPLSPSRLGISNSEITEVVSLSIPPLFFPWSAQTP